MKLLVTKDIYNESNYICLEEDMNYRCNELLEEKKLPGVTFKLLYDLSYSQGSGVWFDDFNISFDELIKYMYHFKMIDKEEYDILYSAHDEGLYDFNYTLGYWNKIGVNTSIYKIEDSNSTRTTYELLTKKYGDHYTDDDGVISWDALDYILDSNQIELALKDLMDSICSDLKKYGYDYIESEDEYQCKNILFDKWCELNNIETNIDYSEGGEYLFNKKDIETNINGSRDINDYTLINNNNLIDYYVENNLINKIEKKEKLVYFNSLII